MQIDKETISVLTNFQMINPSIQIDQGNDIWSKAATGTILAHATVPATFPQTFAIHDLRKFLMVVGICGEEAEFQFFDTYLTITETARKVRFGYCDPRTIVVPSIKPPPYKDSEILLRFDLSKEMLTSAIAGMSVLKHEGLVIEGNQGVLSLKSWNKKGDTNYFSIDIGVSPHDFSFILEAEKIVAIMKDRPSYQVSVIPRTKSIYLRTDDLEYWIACHMDSKIST